MKPADEDFMDSPCGLPQTGRVSHAVPPAGAGGDAKSKWFGGQMGSWIFAMGHEEAPSRLRNLCGCQIYPPAGESSANAQRIPMFLRDIRSALGQGGHACAGNWIEVT